jgi:hypothetical protein
MSDTTKKYYTSKDLATRFLVTIQFYREFSGTGMLLTTNDSNKPLELASMKVHGINMAKNNTNLNPKDHRGLRAFCKSYLEESGYNVK